MRVFWIIITSLLLVGCQQLDKSILAQVGEEKLMLNDVLVLMPLNYNSVDSALFVQQKVDQWINEQLLYQQGLRNVSDLDQLERDAAQYRRDLIARTYQAERLAIYSGEVSEEECLTYYEANKLKIVLKQPIIKGVYIKLMANSTKVNDIKNWLKQILNGNTDHAEELEQFCQQRAVDYDTFIEQWVDMRRLTDRLPNKVYDAGQFLRCQVYQQKDKDYIYIFMISEFHLAGEIQPFEYCYADIHDVLIQQKHVNFRKQLQTDLRDEALRTGLLKMN